MVSFLFGGDTGLTQSDLQRRRDILANLQQRRSASAPRNVGEGLSALGTALGGVIAGQRVRSAEQQLGEYNTQLLRNLMGQNGTGVGTRAPTRQLPDTTGTFNLPAARAAIGQIESAGSGDYAAVGVENAKGQRPYGRYQVMDFNVGPWTEEILGQRMTPEQFVADPEAQEQVFAAKFGEYVQTYGSPQEAASMWFTGEPIERGASRRDVLGTTGAQYVDDFNRLYQAGLASYAAPTTMTAPAAAAPAPGVPAAAGGGLPMPAAPTGGRAPGAPQAGVTRGTSPRIAQLLAAAVDPRASPQVKQMANMLLQQEMRPPARTTLSAGDVLVDPTSGQQIAAAPFKPQPGFTLGPGDVRFGATGERVAAVPPVGYRILTPEEEKERGLPETGAYQMEDVTGKVTQIGGARTQISLVQPKLSPDYAATEIDEQGNIVSVAPIPGSKAAQEIAELEQKAEKRQQLAKSNLGDLNRALGSATTILDRDIAAETANKTILPDFLAPILQGNLPTTGFIGINAMLWPGTNAHKLSKDLETIKAYIAFDRLNEMRQASPTGGALGQVSIYEVELLQSAYTNVAQSQTAEQLKSNLDYLKQRFNQVINEGIPQPEIEGFAPIPLGAGTTIIGIEEVQ